MSDATQLTDAQKAAATKAGMTPEKFAALQGKTTVDEYEQLAEADKSPGKAREN